MTNTRTSCCPINVSAYVFIETKYEKTNNVIATMRGIQGVTSVELVSGIYDVVAKVEGKNWDDIANLVSAKINLISDIYRTATCPLGELP